ncbi:MAG: aminoglycoside phosphotransferase family protein [Candidatus Gottesmanbacteria bacterium]|nr:aminoglycoside phosphotransferase family protein [Candidatus Gottesmanbacteria bacterium]
MNDIYYRHAHRSQSEIDIVSKRFELFDVSWIPKIFKQALGLTATSWIRPDSYGTMHVIYRVTAKEQSREYLLRANYNIPVPEMEMKLEQLITEKVAVLDIPVNHIIHVDISRKVFPFDFQIQEVLSGGDLEDHFTGTKDEYDRMSFALGQYVARLGDIQLKGFGRFHEDQVVKGNLIGTKKSFPDYIEVCLDDDLRFVADSGQITVKIATSIRKLFDQYRPVMNISRGTLVHHDLADHNFMHVGDRITGIFDWENAVSGDPVLDLASAPTWATHFPRESMLIAGYKSLRNLPDHFQEKMDIYRLRTVIWKTVFVTRAGLMNEKRRQRFFDALKSFGMAHS